MSELCTMCGEPVPSGQRGLCSMCYGDPDYGRDGYYTEYLEEQERQAIEDQYAAEAEVRAAEEAIEEHSEEK